jgi:hypothetical protein
MNTQTRTRIARTAAFAVAASITAVTTTVAVPPTTASAPGPERPCFIVQPRWNTAIDGPAPTCPTPSWQRTSGYRWGTPGSSAGTAPRRTGQVSEDTQDGTAPSTRARIDFGDEYGSPR